MVWLIVVVWTLLLSVWSIVVPLFNGPDESQHIDISIDAASAPIAQWFTTEGNRVDERIGQIQRSLGYFDEATVSDPTLGLQRSVGARTLDLAPPREDRLTFGGSEGPIDPQGGILNKATQHPPLYYRLQGGLLTLWPGWQDARADAVLAAMRLLSVATMSLLPLFAAWTVRGLGRFGSGKDRGTEVVAALSVLVIPQMAHLGSVVTNDSLLIGLGGLLLALLAHVCSGDTSVRTGARVGVVALLAVLTKGVALILPVAILAAYWAGSRPTADGTGRDRPVWKPLVVGGAVGLLALGWYGENIVRYGSIQPYAAARATPDVQGPFGSFLLEAFRVQNTTFWGRIGWVETGVDPLTARDLDGCPHGVPRRRGLDPSPDPDSGPAQPRTARRRRGLVGGVEGLRPAVRGACGGRALRRCRAPGHTRRRRDRGESVARPAHRRAVRRAGRRRSAGTGPGSLGRLLLHGLACVHGPAHGARRGTVDAGLGTVGFTGSVGGHRDTRGRVGPTGCHRRVVPDVGDGTG